jgi:DNA-binding PadR family transcriptional regulator
VSRYIEWMTPQAFHILIALAERDLHGYAIMQDVSTRTNGKLRLSPGTLYGSIKRLLEQGLIVELEADDRRRYYRLTPLGRKAAKEEAARLMDLVDQARQYGFAN